MKKIIIDEEDWPRCSKCDMPVEKFCVTDTGDALILVAVCHGKEETVTLSNQFLVDLERPGTIGPAFTTGD